MSVFTLNTQAMHVTGVSVEHASSLPTSGDCRLPTSYLLPSSNVRCSSKHGALPAWNNYRASTGNGPNLSSATSTPALQSYGPQSCHYLRIIEMEREENYNNFTGRLFVYRPRRNGPEIDSNGGPL